MTGVALLTGAEGQSKKKHVHARSSEWEITSDRAIADVPFCDVLDRILPGRLGSYVYPADAVFACATRKSTTDADLASIIAKERSKRTGGHYINHITVAANEVEAPPVDDEDDGSDEDEEEFGEDEVECGDVGEPVQWEEEEDPD